MNTGVNVICIIDRIRFHSDRFERLDSCTGIQILAECIVCNGNDMISLTTHDDFKRNGDIRYTDGRTVSDYLSSADTRLGAFIFIIQHDVGITFILNTVLVIT